MKAMKVHWLVNVTPRAVCNRYGLDQPIVGGWLDSLAQVLANYTDVDVTVSYLTANPYEDFFTADGIGYSPILVKDIVDRRSRRWLHGVYERRTVRAVEMAIRRVGAEIVHVHGTERPFGIAAVQSGTRFVVSLQGVLSVYERMYWRGIARDPRSWFSVRAVLGHSDVLSDWRAMRRRARAERSVLASATAILGRTDFDRRFARIVAPGVPYFHVGEVLRPPFYGESWRGLSSANPTLYTTTGSAPYKGLETLVEAVGWLVRAGYDIRLKVGGEVSGWPIWRRARRIALQMNVFDRVLLLGELDAEAVAHELRSCRVYVCASHIENSPNNIAEAQIVGAPVVAAAAGGIPSLVKDRTTGLLVQDGDPWSMAGAIAELLDDPHLCQRLSEEARREALTRHDPRRVAQQLIEAYEAVLAAD